jgi:hypothetical protein
MRPTANWWRWLSSLMIQDSFVHLAANTLLFGGLGLHLERRYGTMRTLLLVLIAGVAGNFFDSTFTVRPRPLLCVFLGQSSPPGAGAAGLARSAPLQPRQLSMRNRRMCVVLAALRHVDEWFTLLSALSKWEHEHYANMCMCRTCVLWSFRERAARLPC